MATSVSSSTFTVDVHTHAIPPFFRDALVDAGYETNDAGEVYVDGFRVPDFTLESYLENRQKFGYDFSILSITCPGVSFLNGNSQAKTLARKLNKQMSEWSQAYPRTLGAFAVLPLPNIDAALQEVKVRKKPTLDSKQLAARYTKVPHAVLPR